MGRTATSKLASMMKDNNGKDELTNYCDSSLLRHFSYKQKEEARLKTSRASLYDFRVLRKRNGG
jgi:hypothetical protein